MTIFATPAVAWAGNRDADAPLVVLLHGRGSNEHDIIALADHLPDRFAYAAVRAPIAEGGGYAWFANRGIGRPIAESLADTMGWFRTWLDDVAPDGRQVVLVGFSGGAAFAGGLVLHDPIRYAGAAILYGTLPFEAGAPTTDGQLDGVRVLVAHGDADTVIPRELLDRTWQYLHDGSGATVVGVRDPGGRNGLSLYLAILGQPERFVPLADLYRQTGAAAGHDPESLRIGVTSHFYVEDTSQGARDTFYPYYSRYIGNNLPGACGQALPRDAFDAWAGPRGALFTGSPQEIIDKILWEHELLGHDRFLAQIGLGGLPFAQTARSIELLTAEVLPVVRRETGGTAELGQRREDVA